MHLKTALFLALALVTALSSIATAADEPEEQWYGKVADRELMKLAPKTDFIADGESWTNIWTKWSPDEEVPEVDFSKNLVVVATVQGPNRMFGSEKVDEDGNLTFMAGSTRMAGPGFAYLMRRVDRHGIKTVNGNPVPALEDADAEEAPPADSITVHAVGTLQSGVMAIGGETTGTTITSGGITLELDLTGNEELAQLATKLNGQRARAVGTLRRQQGVERPDRWIVAVSKLESVEPVAEPPKSE